MITVHHLENSRSQRVLWMLEELGLPYRVQRYERDPKTMLAPAALKKVHPLGKSPVIVDDETGETVAETAVIVDYLVEKAGGALGPEAGDDRRYRFWLHYAEGSLMPPLLVMLVLSKVPLMGRLAMPRIKAMVDTHLDYIEGELTGKAWFLGETLTGADIMMSFPIEAAARRGGLGDRVAIKTWLARVQSRDAYKKALAAGGPYAFA